VVRALAAWAALCASCGYGFTAGLGRLPAGTERVFVGPFENRTGDAEAGAWVSAALREELARRGRSGPEGAGARLEGEVVSSGFTPSSAATYQQSLVVRVRLMAGGKVLGEQTIGRTEDYLGAIDPLETEGRRRLALRRLAAALARDILERFETF
jgi:hypothetical protein